MAPHFAGVLLLAVLAVAGGAASAQDSCNSTIVSELSWLADALADGSVLATDNATGLVAKINYPQGIFGYRDTVRAEAGNPVFGYPWITVGGVEAKLGEPDSQKITVGDHRFGAFRYNDYSAAKDMVVRVYS